MEITTTTHSGARAAVNGLAVVGFVALIVLGMGLAVYSARFVPSAVSGLASAGVYFSSLFSPADDANLEVVPTEIPFGETPLEETPAAAATSTPAETPAQPAAPVVPSAGPSTSGTYYPVGGGVGTVSPENFYGLPDLTVTITAVGYLAQNNKPDTFVAAGTIPNNKQGAIKFTITNIGTNKTGAWELEVEVPTSPSAIKTFNMESMGPNQQQSNSIIYFDRAREGENREITVRVDSDRDVDESNESNNDDSATIDIE